MEFMVPKGKYGQCKCCLKHTYLRNMWEAHKNKGEIEVYGQMLVDCFSINWTIVTMEDDNICQVCISKLKVSNDFKKQVLESQAATLEAAQVEDNPEDNIVEEMVITQNDEHQFIKEVIMPKELITTPAKKINSKTSLKEEAVTPVKEDLAEKSSDDDSETSSDRTSDRLGMEKSECDPTDRNFEDVVFLEEDCLDEYGNDNDEEPKNKRKRTRNLQTRYQRTTYRNYLSEDMEKAVSAVTSGQMNKREAARVYNVPRESVAVKAVSNVVDKPFEDLVTKHLVNAIRALLTYTNATPFKLTRRKPNSFICFYCGLGGPAFLQPDELRNHTHKQHPDKIEQTEFAVRPRCLNQMIRLDIYKLKCKCKQKVIWEDLLDHLKAKHKVTDIDEAIKIIVPYELQTVKDVMFCVFQSCDYSGCFAKLDVHMHQHFPNYICGDCGKTFASEMRLKRHEKFHIVGEYPCDECEIIFSSKKKRKFHQDTVHEKKCLYKCLVCPLRFETDKQRSDHLREDHKDLVETKGRKCNLCGNSFWPRDFTRHMKFVHDKHSCKVCGRRFDRAERLKRHECRPDMETKKFKCGICSRLFLTQQSVLTHMMKMHGQD